MEIKKRIDELIRLVNYYDNVLHIQNNPIVSEEEYDTVRKELENLENDYPKYFRSDSPTLFIQYKICKKDKKIKRINPLLSLRHTYSIDESKNNINNMLNVSDYIIVEPKIDGVAVEIHYINNLIESISLRGNGFEGEDISHFIPYIKNLCLKIDNFTGYIRGEIYVPKNFIESNHRNYVAGSLRKKVADDYNLNFIPYKLIIEKKITYLESLEFLAKHFEKTIFYKKSNDINLVIEYIKEIWAIDFDFVIDGSIIKSNINDITYTGRYHNNIFAYKFSSSKYQSVIKDIIWNLDRSGNLIPTCIIEPITIDGAVIKKINGHNKKYLQIKKIGIGTHISICRKGNIVPQILSVLSNENTINIEKCPECQNLVKELNIHYVCDNSKCLENKKKFFFFKCLNIEGLSNNILDRFKNLSILEIIDKLKIQTWCTNVNDQKVYQLYNQQRKEINLKKILECLSIPGISSGFLNKLPQCENLKDIYHTEFHTATGKKLHTFCVDNQFLIEDIIYKLNT